MGWTFGINAVETALQDSADQVLEVWVVKARKPSRARERVVELATERGVRYRLVSDDQLRRAVGDVVHQGVAARVTEFTYAEAEAVLAPPNARSMIVVLDEVQDPHNLGAVMRTARAFGASGVVIPKHRAAAVTPAARKVASGAAETLPVARVTNLARFLEQAKAAGYWAYAAEAHQGEALESVRFAERAVLVLGAEDKGVRPNVRAHCDAAVRIGVQGVESLNVSVAAGILMYAWAVGAK